MLPGILTARLFFQSPQRSRAGPRKRFHSPKSTVPISIRPKDFDTWNYSEVKMPGTNGLKTWRWIFIVVQTTVFVTFLVTVALEFGFGISIEPQPESLAIALAVAYMLALFFLLIASPFFFKSLGKLAVIGWILAFTILVVSMCFPARAEHL